MKAIAVILACAGCLGAGGVGLRAGTFQANFDEGQVPANAAVFGNTVVESTGGVNNSGVLKITKAINSQSGSFILQDLDSGNPIYGFDMSFKVRLGGGTSTPADGFSINFAGDLPDGTFGEEGSGSGISFTFDIYDNGSETPAAPSIDVKMGGQFVATSKQTIASLSTGNDFAEVHIQLNPDGSLNMSYKGTVLFTNLFLPNYQPMTGRFGIGGRTGGSNANQWIDDLQITTFLQPKVGISQQPFSEKVPQGDDAVFEVRITNPDGASLQWFKNGAAIGGATSTTLTVAGVSSADTGNKYKVQVTGPNNTVTSDEVTLTVVDLPLPATPKLSFNFNDGAIPAGTSLTGTALVDTTGGSANSGVLKLTINENDQAGAMIIPDADAGAAVYGFTARFKVLMGGGSTVPADGFCFALASDIPDSPTGRFEEGEGMGSGLNVDFDIYNNDTIVGTSAPAEASRTPSVDVRYNNRLVASTPLPISYLDTGTDYADVVIRLNTDGTISVVYRGLMVHDHVVVPGFTAIAGGRFAVAARTGGLNENIWLDDLQISTDLTPGNVRIATQPASQTVLVTRPATFNVVLNDAAGATYQWLRNGTPVSGATSDSLTIPAAAVSDSGAKFAVQVTKGGASVTSDPATLTVLDLAPPTNPTASYSFNDGQVPAGTAVFGNATVSANGGVNDSGVLQLTINENGQASGFVIPPVLGGAELSGLTVAFDLRLGGGTTPPADGLSFNFAPGLPSNTIGGAEDGTGNGLTIGFDIYDNGSETPPAPSIDVRYKGAVVASTQLSNAQLDTGADFRSVLIRVTPDGKLDLAFGDRVLQTGLQLPNYTFTAGGKFGFYARTGGLNENQWVDNILIAATKSSAPLNVVVQPADVAVLPGKTATFTVGLNDPNGASYQWNKNGTAITGATGAAYTTPTLTLADDGTKFTVRATGPGGAATSREALLTVVAPITVNNPQVSFDFNDGSIPPGTALVAGTGGGGIVDFSGGVGNSGVLKLTDAVNGEAGTFYIQDFSNGGAVSSFAAHFSALVGGGTVPPADGFGFVWASDLDQNGTFGEDGSGSGLTLSFDIYDNGGGEAPAFNVVYHGQSIATNKVELAALETGGQFADVFVRVNADGTLDLQYNGNVIFNRVPLTGYAPLAGGLFAIGARTGGYNDNQWFDNIQIATSTAVVAPPISAQRSGNNLVLSWGPGFKLQSTVSLKAPVAWADVSNAVSPYTAGMTSGAQFYRLVNAP